MIIGGAERGSAVQIGNQTHTGIFRQLRPEAGKNVMKTTLQAYGAALIVALVLSACFRQDIRTVEVNVPRLSRPECARIIQDALGSVDGVVSVVPDLENHTVAVTYDSTKLAIKNIEFVIAGVGFDAGDTPAKPDAREKLPPPCR